MRNKFEFEDERNKDLLNKYKVLIELCEFVKMPDIYKQLSQMPAERFWVSEKRAAIVIGKMMQGSRLEGMRPQRAAMFREIYRRTMELKEKKKGASINKLVSEVVMQPAPSFYLTEDSAKVILCKLRKREINGEL